MTDRKVSESVPAQLVAEGVTAISREVFRVIGAAFDPRGGRLPVPSPGRAFVVEVLRMAQKHEVALSEADFAELVEAAMKLEVAGQTAALIGGVLGDALRGSFERLA